MGDGDDFEREGALWSARMSGTVLPTLLFAAFLWFARRGGRGARLWYSLVVLASFVYLAQLYYWNLLFLWG